MRRLQDWFTPENLYMQKKRDKSKRLKQWSDCKRYRNQRVNRKVQERPQAEAAANPRHQEEEKK